MDWTQIILAIIGIIGGIDLFRLLFLKLDKKQKKAEIVSVEVETLRHANDLLSQQLDRASVMIRDKDEAVSSLQAERAVLLSTQSCLFDDMCIHKGCRLRKPHQGKGSTWYETYKDDPTLGADYLSVDTLIKADRENRLRNNEGGEAADNA